MSDRTPARVLGIAGVAGLLIIFVVVVSLIAGAAGGDDDEPEVAATPTATATPTPTRTPKPKPTPEPLTADEKLDRQDDIDVVASRGFEIVNRRDWNPDDTLQVLIGEASSGSELAFFFVDGTYLGNDSTEPSTKLRVRKTDDLTVQLRYSIYTPDDEPGKPTGEPIDVEFRYAGGTVEPVTAIPAPEQRLR